MKLFRLLPIVAALAFVCGLVYMWMRVPPGNDFYAPYVGAQRVLDGLSPYGEEGAKALATSWDDPFAAAGIAYPLPLLLLVIPFAMLPFSIAALLWTILGFVMAYPVALLSRTLSVARTQPSWSFSISLILPLVFWPFFRAVRIGQASLLWFGLAVILVLAIHHKKAWLVAICVVLLVLKPQTGLIFALYGTWWLLRHASRWLWLSTVLGGGLFALSLAMQPAWIGEWLDQVRIYEQFVDPPSLLPVAIVFMAAFWFLHKPAWVMVSLLQAVLFPISDVYSSLPTLLAWSAFSPPLAVVGASFSWLMLLYPATKSASAIGLFIYCPLIIAALWEARPRPERTRQLEGTAS